MVRLAAMSEYKALIFDMNQLVRWASVEAPDDLTAIRSIPKCDEAAKIELWRDDLRLATIRCAANEVRKFR